MLLDFNTLNSIKELLYYQNLTEVITTSFLMIIIFCGGESNFIGLISFGLCLGITFEIASQVIAINLVNAGMFIDK